MNTTHPSRSPGSTEVERLIVVDIIRQLLLRAAEPHNTEEYLALVQRVRVDLDATLGGARGLALTISDSRFDIAVASDAHGTTVRVRERTPHADFPLPGGTGSAFVQVTRDTDGTTVLRIIHSDDLEERPESIRALVERLFPVTQHHEAPESPLS